jgi:hypothetical protein
MDGTRLIVATLTLRKTSPNDLTHHDFGSKSQAVRTVPKNR